MTKKVTNLRLPPECHNRARAAALLLKESLSDFIAKSVDDRIEKLKKEGTLTL